MYPIPKNWGKKSLVVVIAVSFYPSSTNMDLYTALSSLQTRLKGFTFFLFIYSVLIFNSNNLKEFSIC